MNTYTQPLIAARYSTTAGQSIANSGTTIVDFGTKDYDTVGSVTTGGSWKFTAPKSSFYSISCTILYASLATTAGNLRYIGIFKNGTISAYVDYQQSEATVTSELNLTGQVNLYLNKGDYIDARLFYNRTGGNSTLNTAAGCNYIEILEIAGATQNVGNNTKVMARYTTTTGSVANTGENLVDFGTKDYDTHGAVTTGGSWKFTAPDTGYYTVNVQLTFASASITAGNRKYGTIYKNGSFFSAFNFDAIDLTTTVEVAMNGSTTLLLNKGDYIDFRAAFNRTGGSTNINSASGYTYIEIKKE